MRRPPRPASAAAQPAGSGVDEAGVAVGYLRPMGLAQRIGARGSEFLLFALTPPRITVTRERAQEIADVTQKRLTPLGLDGLLLYDIDDESDRNPQERPFPFLPTMDPAAFRAQHLQGWDTPVVVYRAVGKYREVICVRGWKPRTPTTR